MNSLPVQPYHRTKLNFVNLIIDHLTENGIMEPSALYESPSIDINSQGPEWTAPRFDRTGSVAR